MAIMQRLNKQIKVQDTDVDKYLGLGYDEINSDGKVVKNATGNKVVSVEEYNKLKEELNAYKAKKNKQNKEEQEKEQDS